MVAMAMVVMGDMCVQSHPHTTTISNFYVGKGLYSLRLVVVKHYCQCIMVIHSTIMILRLFVCDASMTSLLWLGIPTHPQISMSVEREEKEHVEFCP